jgi:hypothetical protein
LVTRSNSHKLIALISDLPNLNNEKTNGNVKITKITLEEEEPDVKESIKSRKSKISLNKENIKKSYPRRKDLYRHFQCVVQKLGWKLLLDSDRRRMYQV